MAARLDYGVLHDNGEADALETMLSRSFVIPVDQERRWLERIGHRNLRVIREGNRPVACLGLLPGLGQYFGGRRVPTVGIAGVATSPESRGRGAGTVLMRTAMQELHREGVALSTLYPATQPIYRRAGFEQAGGRWEIRAAPAVLDMRDRTLPLRELDAGDRPALAELHREALREGSGGIDRSPYLWDRVFHPRGETTFTTGVVGRSGALEGYVVSATSRDAEGAVLHLHDFVARTPAAATRLLTFLADHQTMIREVVWHGSAADPLLCLVREQKAQLRLPYRWMLRIVDLERALAARGYPEGLTSELHLEIFDEVIPENRGRFLLEVGGGSGHVRRGGEGRIKLHVRGLAALYSGWLDPHALALTGLLEGESTELRRAQAIFAGPTPAMTDIF